MKSWFKHVWAWMRRRNNDQGDDVELAPLREFIYLDEVSVYSLRASRRGAIESTQTDSHTSEWRQTIESEVGAATPIVKAAAKSHYETGSSQGTQVARKWIIQSTFKELVDSEKSNMRIRSSEPPADPLRQVEAEELLALDQSQGVLRCSSLRRGDLLELEVELSPEDVFTASQLVKSMFTFFEEMPDIFRLDREVFDLGRRFEAVFDRLLVGLVPIRARIVGQHLLSLDGEQILVSEHLIEANPHLRVLRSEPVYLVGVAERELFWRDLRRVLFSESRFLVMCRLSGDGLTTKWNPIKMTNVIDGVAPSIASEIQKLPKEFLGGFRSEAEPTASSTDQVPNAAVEFARKLADLADTDWTEADSLALNIGLMDPTNLDERRELSRAVVERLEGRLDLKMDPLAVAQLRSEVFDDSDSNQNELLTDPRTEGDENLLETEIVAIYW